MARAAILLLLASLASAHAFAVSAGRTLTRTRSRRRASNCRAIEEMNGLDADYPWRFEGRLWFRPAFVRVKPDALPDGVHPVALFGWTIGGVVALEYDESPVGPYVEYVTMGSLVTKRGAFGQWGSNLYVSTQPAEEVCKRTWGVPAELADISFVEAGGSLKVDCAPRPPHSASPPQIVVGGWKATRSAADGASQIGGLPVLWTPRIKALWAPLVPLPESAAVPTMPLHPLRLSASSLRLELCGQPSSPELGVPLGIGLSVDGVRIEIGPQQAAGL